MSEQKFVVVAAESSYKPSSETWKLDDPGRVDKVRRALGSVFGKESKLELPRVVFDVYYAGHGDANDARNLERPFSSCDVYIPEWAGWDEGILEKVNSVSKGALTPQQAYGQIRYSNEYQLQLFRMLYKSNKPVCFVDYRSDERGLQREVEAVRDILSISQYWTYGRTFKDKVQSVKRRLREGAESTLEREEKVLARIKPALTAVIENNPELKKKAIKKGELRVLLSYGSLHTQLFQTLANEGEEVTRSFPTKPYVNNLMLEGERRYYFGKEVDDNLAAQILIECLIDGVFRRDLKYRLPTSEDIMKLERDLASKFSYGEVEEIVEECPNGDFNVLRKALLEKTREKTDILDNSLKRPPQL